MRKHVLSLAIIAALVVSVLPMTIGVPVASAQSGNVTVENGVTTTPDTGTGSGGTVNTSPPDPGGGGSQEPPTTGPPTRSISVRPGQNPVVRWDWYVDNNNRVVYEAVTDPNKARPARGISGTSFENPWSSPNRQVGETVKCSSFGGIGGDQDCAVVTVTTGPPPPGCVLLATGAGSGDGASAIFYCPITPGTDGIPGFLGSWGPSGYGQGELCINEWVIFVDDSEVRRVPAGACTETFQETIEIVCDGQPKSLSVGYTIKLVGDAGSTWLDSNGQFRGPGEVPDPNQIHGRITASGGIGQCAQGDGGAPGTSTVTVDGPKAWSSDGAEGYAVLSWGGPTTLSTTRSFVGYSQAPSVTNYPPQESSITSSTPQIGMRFFYPSDDPSAPNSRGPHNIAGTANILVQWNEYIGRTYAGPASCIAKREEVWRVRDDPDNLVPNHPSSGLWRYPTPSTVTWTTRDNASGVAGAWSQGRNTDGTYRWAVVPNPWNGAQLIRDYRTGATYPIWDVNRYGPRYVPMQVYETASWESVEGDACGMVLRGSTLDVLNLDRVDRVPFSFDVEVYGPRLTR